MKKESLSTKFKKFSIHILRETNTLIYIGLLSSFVALALFSLTFDTTEKPFTVISSIGCGGISSVIAAGLVECANNKKIKLRNKEIINQLLYGFDIFTKIECEQAIRNCAKLQDVDIDKNFTILEIREMLQELKPNNAYFKGFSDMINNGMNGITEVTILSFDQTGVGSNLYDSFIALRSTLETISKICNSNEINSPEEMIKLLVIDCLDSINEINIIRGKNITYQLSDNDKKYIENFRKALEFQKSKSDIV